MNEVILCRAASRTFKASAGDSVTAVDRVDLAVRPREFIAIQGPSGSGKTTLLALFAGIDLPDAGVIAVLGHDLANLSMRERARLRRSRIGIVFQSFGLVAALTAGENVALPLALEGMDPPRRDAFAFGALSELGLEHLIDARIDELSGGERQRVGIARALVTDPDLVLADEPAGSLDDDTAALVLDVLEASCRQRGASLVLVTHDPMSAARADRRLSMSDGQLVSAP